MRGKQCAGWGWIALFACTSALAAEVEIRFDQPRQIWDGFGINYVETAQTRDYDKWPQDYGGMSTLAEEERQEVIRLIFGEDGLRPGLVKMFIDPFHEGLDKSGNDNDDPMKIDLDGYTHERTTKNMRYFVREGLKLIREAGRDLTIISTLYGPPAWTNQQKMIRGRDLDPAEADEVAEYAAAFAKFMREREGFPVKYVSLHNEGEQPIRYNPDGLDAENLAGHDYNLNWKPEQIADMVCRLRKVLDANGMKDVGPTPGENTYWSFFRPFAQAIAGNPCALQGLGLITSHGFDGGTNPAQDYYSPIQDTVGIRLLKSKRPDLHVWTTSASWGAMDINFLSLIQRAIYDNDHNGFIPWAAVQRHSQWVKGDPNPGCAVVVDEEGNFSVRPGYSLYKQVSRIGQPGMRVATVSSDDPYIGVIAFARNQTNNPDAFAVFNRSWYWVDVNAAVSGTLAQSYSVYRTVADTFPEKFWISKKPEIESYAQKEDAAVQDGRLLFTAPPLSVTTFVAK